MTDYEGYEVEVPAWLNAKADQMIAHLEFLKILEYASHSYDVMVIPLVPPAADATAAELEDLEFTCDSCGQVKGRDESMQVGSINRRMSNGKREIQLHLVYGLCQNCKLPPKA